MRSDRTATPTAIRDYRSESAPPRVCGLWRTWGRDRTGRPGDRTGPIRLAPQPDVHRRGLIKVQFQTSLNFMSSFGNTITRVSSPGDDKGERPGRPAAPSSVDLARMAPAGLRAFVRIAGLWGLTVEEQLVLLGAPPRSTFFAWRKTPERANLSRDTLERISYLLGIYKSLQILFPDASVADAWVRKPNTAPLFAGHSALDRMLAGNVSDLASVRRYLDAVRGGGWS